MIIFDKDNTRYFFIHIPKNAGKSFMEQLSFLGHIHPNKKWLNISNSELQKNIQHLHRKFQNYSYQDRTDIEKKKCFWHIDKANDIDMAHIPLKLIPNYAGEYLNIIK